ERKAAGFGAGQPDMLGQILANDSAFRFGGADQSTGQPDVTGHAYSPNRRSASSQKARMISSCLAAKAGSATAAISGLEILKSISKRTRVPCPSGSNVQTLSRKAKGPSTALARMVFATRSRVTRLV